MTAAGSASSKTTTGALPPSSRWRRFTRSAATLAMCLPVSVSPVTEIIPTLGWPTSVIADRRAGAGDDVEHAGRQDVRRRSRPSMSAVSGVRADGLRMTVLPAARAGPIFQPAIMIG